MSVLRKSSTFTMFATKLAATCAATSIPYAYRTFAMTYSVRPHSQAASFGSTLPDTGTYFACYKVACIARTPSIVGTSGLLVKSLPLGTAATIMQLPLL